MQIQGVAVDPDAFAEAFPMRATRLLVTADTPRWARIAGESATGFATSVIGCGVEADIEREVPPAETPDGRPGVALLLFAISRGALEKAIAARVGQSVLTCPGTACFTGLDAEERLPLGRALRYFGDGFQTAKRVGGRRLWRIPVMDGEFLCEDTTGTVKAVGGGNIMLLGRDRAATLAAAERAAAAIRAVPGAIAPFPGGVVRSGSKVGSRYRFLTASTNERYCPTLRGLVDSVVEPEAGAMLELVIDGLTAADVAAAMRAALLAACKGGAAEGLLRVTAGNYGGKLGPFHFHLREVLA